MPLADFMTTHAGVGRRLLELRRLGQWGHAYLMLGDDINFLEAYAKAWLQGFPCTDRRPDGDACGVCDACRAFDHGNSPELHILRSTSKSRQILVDEVRAIERQLGLTTISGGLKMALLIEADCMNPQAQNAFLKTLEEPPPNTILVLLSAQPRQLLPTVLSRCQILHLSHNRLRYDVAIAAGLFPTLATMRRGAGAAAAITGTHRLGVIFNRLRQEAEAAILAAFPDDPKLAELAAGDKGMEKQVKEEMERLQEERSRRSESEYRRRRGELLDAIHVWFMQQQLLAAGVAAEQLPHPELLAAAGVAGTAVEPMTWSAAEAALREAEDLRRYLTGNTSETLCLEAFCLSVCEKK